MSIPGSRFYPIVVQRVVLCSTRADYRERTEANSFCNDRCLLTFPFDQQPRLLRDRREIRICIYKPPVRDLARPKKCMKKSQSGVTRRRTSLFSKIRSAANSCERFTKLVERIPISTSTLGTERRIFEIETKKCIKIVGANYRNIEIEFSRATNFEWRKFDPRFDRLEAGRKRAVRILA